MVSEGLAYALIGARSHFHLPLLPLGDAASHPAAGGTATSPLVNLVSYKNVEQKFGTGQGLVRGRLGRIIKSGCFSLHTASAHLQLSFLGIFFLFYVSMVLLDSLCSFLSSAFLLPVEHVIVLCK